MTAQQPGTVRLRKTIALFVAVAAVSVTALVWMGVRLLTQERALEAQRLQERREAAADKVGCGAGTVAAGRRAPARVPDGGRFRGRRRPVGGGGQSGRNQRPARQRSSLLPGGAGRPGRSGGAVLQRRTTRVRRARSRGRHLPAATAGRFRGSARQGWRRATAGAESAQSRAPRRGARGLRRPGARHWDGLGCARRPGGAQRPLPPARGAGEARRVAAGGAAVYRTVWAADAGLLDRDTYLHYVGADVAVAGRGAARRRTAGRRWPKVSAGCGTTLRRRAEVCRWNRWDADRFGSTAQRSPSSGARRRMMSRALLAGPRLSAAPVVRRRSSWPPDFGSFRISVGDPWQRPDRRRPARRRSPDHRALGLRDGAPMGHQRHHCRSWQRPGQLRPAPASHDLRPGARGSVRDRRELLRRPRVCPVSSPRRRSNPISCRPSPTSSARRSRR